MYINQTGPEQATTKQSASALFFVHSKTNQKARNRPSAKKKQKHFFFFDQLPLFRPSWKKEHYFFLG